MRSLSARSAGDPSPTLALNETVAQLRRSGADIISFGAGAPTVPPPQVTFGALADFDVATSSGYGGSRGERALLAALCGWYRTAFAASTTPEHHLVTNGAKQAIMIALLALCDAGDQIAISDPYWPSYPDMAKLAGVTVELLPYESGAPDVNAWIDRVSDRTKVVMYSSPANPTGSVLTLDDIRTLTAWARDTGRWIIADEIYQFQYFRAGGAAPSVLQLPVEQTEQVLHISSASKTFALMGHRVGWITAHPDVIRRCAGIASNMAGNVNTPAQALVARALSTPRAELSDRCAQLERQRDVLCSGLESVPWLRWRKPDGGLFVWCELASAYVGDWDGDAIAAALLADQHVAVVPGSAFGHRDAVRLSFTEPADQIRAGVERIKTWGRERL
ncbi:pyridoxal phosphate-dependent aminotransferase [Mycobacterium sp. ML4]